MDFNSFNIPAAGRSNYGRYSTTAKSYSSGSSSTAIGGKSGLPYYIDDNGNCVIDLTEDTDIIFPGNIIGQKEVSAFGAGTSSSGGTATDLSGYYSKEEIDSLDYGLKVTDTEGSTTIQLKHDTDAVLNLKTINGVSLIGAGNITVEGGEGGGTVTEIAVIDNLESTAPDAALSANQGRILKSLIDSKETDLTDYYTKGEVDSLIAGVDAGDLSGYVTEEELAQKGYITSIPDEYITETELAGKGYLTGIPSEYITEEELTGKGYLTSVPDEYITETEMGTALDDYYTKGEADSLLGDKVDTSTWDTIFSLDDNGNLHVKTNLIGDKEISAFGDGDSAVSSTVIVVDSLTSTSTEAALSANQGRVLNSKFAGYSPTGHTHSFSELSGKPSTISGYGITDAYTKTEVDTLIAGAGSGNIDLSSYVTEEELAQKGFITSVPDEYITETELAGKGYLTAIPSEYVTENELSQKGYLTAIPSEYITEAELSQKGFITSVPDEYVTETEMGTALDGKLDKTVWEGVFEIDDNGNLHCTTNFIGDKEVSAFGEGDSAMSTTVIVVDNLTSSSSEAALSAKQGKVLKELIDSKQTDLSGYYTKTEVDTLIANADPDLSGYVTELELAQKGYLTGIPSEYITETELAEKGYLTAIPDEYITETELTGKGYLTAIPDEYITETELAGKGYLTAIPDEYVTGTELTTELGGYYTKGETDTALADKVDTSVWDKFFSEDTDGNLLVKTNLIGQKEVSAYGAGNSAVGGIDVIEGQGEWYNIHTKRLTSKSTTFTDMYCVIENFDDVIANDPDNYRIVLMTFKRKKGEGNRWRVPMFSPRWNCDTGSIVNSKTPCNIAWADSWWTITGNKTLWWSNTSKKYNEVINTDIETTNTAFRNNNNKKQKFGCCVMKKVVGSGTYGWQRISNIAEVQLFALDTGKHHVCVIQ